MQAAAVLETCLYVDDLDCAEVFYGRVLGLERVARENGRHVFFRCGPGMFLVFNAGRTSDPGGDVPRHGAAGPGHVAFLMTTEQVERWRRHLAEHGVAIEQEITEPNGRHSLYFRDPAGNSVELATPQTWEL